MKTTWTSLLLALCITGAMAQKKITVEANSNDISNNLDLQAVASLFGESDDLEDFERRLNDYDSQLSNLDLNNDGEVDYLRVLESTEKGVHVILVQAVLAKDVFQDVATIAVEKKNNRRTYVQVIGDPYMYGSNYIIEPVYVYTPRIYTSFWGNSYQSWSSPYFWGYYPTYYRYRAPCEVNIYLSGIHSHINYSHHYYYRETSRIYYSDNVYRSLSRNDYASRYPERAFTSRNLNQRNKLDIQPNRGGVKADGRIDRQNSTQGNSRTNASSPARNQNVNRTGTNQGRSNGAVNSRGTETRSNSNVNSRSNESRTNGNVNSRSNESRSNGNVNSRSNESRSNGNVNSRSNESRSNGNVNSRSNENRSNSNTRVTTPSQNRQNSGENRTSPSVNRDNNNRSTSPSVAAPSRNTPSVAPRSSAPSNNGGSRQSAPAQRNAGGSSNGNRR